MLRAAVLLLALCATQAFADCRTEVSSAQLSGEGDFSMLGFRLYHAQLWSAHLPVSYDAGFALQLTYARHIARERLASTGIGEIKRLANTPIPPAQLEQWQRDMERAFTDVEAGDQLCGVFVPGAGVRFYSNGTPTVTIDDAAFARAFFDIWLDPQTRAPDLRQRLLAGGQGLKD